LDFPCAPSEQKPLLLQQLLPYERAFAVSNDDIGEVPQFQFNINMPESAVPVKMKPIWYDKSTRAWLNNHLSELQSLGLVE
jgi:hypothetical protein